MSSEDKANKRGGARPGAGRRKTERPTNANVAAKVLKESRAEQMWHALIKLECRRLGIGDDGKLLPPKIEKDKDGKDVITGPDYQGRFSVIPLSSLLRYLEDRAYGRPVDTVNHVHDKPIDVNVNVSIAEIIRKVRQRKQEYERSRS